ncbi:hypothetical protein MIC97_08820 [Aquamicrobium sp. NLF2-7]|uniref:hypothetical protein n=1 Tax=Aquamicrobium sp. NLF2-7 TaxID=2918753 RepID=UPI001EFBF02A|nr:hypothetical protein [Aquamicrobium sp. NLF2-7]MCG8271603.1 hypothetical protein [Aquamicrobium sp. NLF2-7]
MLTERERTRRLGLWGERKAFALLQRAGFLHIRDMNEEIFNFPFADIYAERDREKFLIGVKTRNMYQVSGPLNPSFNVRKKGFDVDAIAAKYEATLAWVAVQVIPELGTYWAHFGTVDKIQEQGERFSIPMTKPHLGRYECLAREETDETLDPRFSNGGYPSFLSIARPKDSLCPVWGNT